MHMCDVLKDQLALAQGQALSWQSEMEDMNCGNV